MTAMACPELEAVAPELALGLVEGEERAAALAHLAHCPDCRDLVDGLVKVADGLLLLGPEAEPPIGFESRVLGRLALPARPASPSRQKRALIPVAAAVIAALATAGGLLGGRAVGHAGGRSPGMEIAVSRWRGGTCWVTAVRSRPAQLVVLVDEPGREPEDYAVEALRATGPTVSLGTIHIEDGYGVLRATVPAGTGPVTGVRVIEPGGGYRATFPAV